MNSVLQHCVLAASSLFAPFVVPLSDPEARVLLAPRSGKEGALILVAAGRAITVYDAQLGTPTSMRLPDGVSAWEYCDLNADGKAEIVAVRGRDVLSIDANQSIADGGDTPFRVLFSQDNLYAGEQRPFPQVLTVKVDGQTRIVLPTSAGVEIFDAAGLPEAALEGILASPLGRTFNVVDSAPPLYAPADALEMRITVLESGRSLPVAGDAAGETAPRAMPVAPRQARDAINLPLGSWPNFPLGTVTSAGRAHYALSGGMSPDTLVAVATLYPSAAAGSSDSATLLRTGPSRRYPGALLLPEGPLPDINGDGWTDLLLWRVPLPTPTLDAISRAALAKHWPVRITAHPFNPAKRRFEPRAQGMIEVNAPLGWLLSEGGREPLQHVLLRDLDGDGNSDFSCFTDPRTFQVWLSQGGGFGGVPDYTHTFPEHIDTLVFVAPLEAGMPDSIGFRTEGSLHVLRNLGIIDAASSD